MRYTYFIEDRGTYTWWTGDSWTTDPHSALQFDDQDEATSFVSRNSGPFKGHKVEVTEHIFAGKQSPYVYRLN